LSTGGHQSIAHTALRTHATKTKVRQNKPSRPPRLCVSSYKYYLTTKIKAKARGNTIQSREKKKDPNTSNWKTKPSSLHGKAPDQTMMLYRLQYRVKNKKVATSVRKNLSLYYINNARYLIHFKCKLLMLGVVVDNCCCCC